MEKVKWGIPEKHKVSFKKHIRKRDYSILQGHFSEEILTIIYIVKTRNAEILDSSNPQEKVT